MSRRDILALAVAVIIAPFASVASAFKRATPVIYDVRSPDWDGIPRRVFDANGREMHKVIRCNVETGEITRYKTAGDGTILLDKDRLVAYCECIQARPPLRVVRTLPEVQQGA